MITTFSLVFFGFQAHNGEDIYFTSIPVKGRQYYGCGGKEKHERKWNASVPALPLICFVLAHGYLGSQKTLSDSQQDSKNIQKKYFSTICINTTKFCVGTQN